MINDNGGNEKSEVQQRVCQTAKLPGYEVSCSRRFMRAGQQAAGERTVQLGCCWSSNTRCGEALRRISSLIHSRLAWGINVVMRCGSEDGSNDTTLGWREP